MALVHETLYGSDSFAAVEFAEYARTLAAQLVRTYGLPERPVVLKTALDPVHMGIDFAVPCGLVLNELITNALKHAFPAGRAGEIELTLNAHADGTLLLQVADNGVGLPNGFDVNSAQSMGFRLVLSLARQIRGTFDVQPAHPGTVARIALRLYENNDKP
jgi:two-component sensor histidine kinase